MILPDPFERTVAPLWSSQRSGAKLPFLRSVQRAGDYQCAVKLTAVPRAGEVAFLSQGYRILSQDL